jgi:hypothetical protein
MAGGTFEIVMSENCKPAFVEVGRMQMLEKPLRDPKFVVVVIVMEVALSGAPARVTVQTGRRA